MNDLAQHRLLGRCLIAPTAIAAQLAGRDFPWAGLIETANRGYLTPALYVALRDAALVPTLPADVAQYLGIIAERNDVRNARLRTQLGELVGALNRRGVVPLLLKGAAGLFGTPERYAASRMVTDLDLLIAPGQVQDACAALADLGYRRLEGRATGRHAVGDFIRDIDVGAVDLHVALINEPGLLPVADAMARAVERTEAGSRALVLAPTDRVLHLLLHDLVQDHGIHDGRLNVRHLHELAALAYSGAPVRWDEIAAHLARHRLRRLAEVAMLAAHVFFAASPPPAVRPSLGARLLFWRSLLILQHPRLMRCGEIFGNAHRSLAWYRHAGTYKRLPRLRRGLDYLRTHRIRTARRVLHVLFTHRA
jgi:putative nucleotidyltransferase-like protein